MAGMMDNMKSKMGMGDLSEEELARMQQLQTDAKMGSLSEDGKSELERLRNRFEQSHS
jgi:hypothetical protein